MTKMAMTKPAVNPWEQMAVDTSRRVDVQTKHDFFWIKDFNDRYGLLIKFSFTNIQIPVQIKGVTIIVKPGEVSSNVYFLLKNNNDWEIFLSICSDLIHRTCNCTEEDNMVSIIIQRITRWQKFLDKNNSASMSEIQQMGLFTELYCLLHTIIPVFGTKESISSWVGPDSDKKDFSLKDFFVEVKSYISSKGEIIKISSFEQLDAEIKPLYLITYGLTRTNYALSIVDLVSEINKYISLSDHSTRDEFEVKLASYGYVENAIAPPFYNYFVDIQKTYLVSNDFPKVLKTNIDSRIISFEYKVDLSRCASYQTLLPI